MDGLGGQLGELEAARDGCAAIATELHELPGDFLAAGSNRDESGSLLQNRSTGRDVSGDVAEGGDGAGPVGGFEIGFGGAVVSAKKTADLCGIARAPQVLQEQS